jgi:hypothetical protein
MTTRALILVSLALMTAPLRAEADPVFKITLDKALATAPVSGRLILLAHAREEPLKVAGFKALTEVMQAGTEVTALGPGASLDVHAEKTLGYPTPFAKLPAGSWHFQALLDLDHSYAYSGPGEGDLTSGDVFVEAFDASASPRVELRLSAALPPRIKIEETERVRLFTLESRLLSDFWHRPIVMRAAFVLPKDPAKDECCRRTRRRTSAFPWPTSSTASEATTARRFAEL